MTPLTEGDMARIKPEAIGVGANYPEQVCIVDAVFEAKSDPRALIAGVRPLANPSVWFHIYAHHLERLDPDG